MGDRVSSAFSKTGIAGFHLIDPERIFEAAKSVVLSDKLKALQFKTVGNPIHNYNHNNNQNNNQNRFQFGQGRNFTQQRTPPATQTNPRQNLPNQDSQQGRRPFFPSSRQGPNQGAAQQQTQAPPAAGGPGVA